MPQAQTAREGALALLWSSGPRKAAKSKMVEGSECRGTREHQSPSV